MSKRRVVITGLGIVSPVGNAVESAWENIISGKSGITRISRFDASNFASQIAGEVKDFDIQAYLSVKEARRMDTFIHFGMAAGIQAIRDANLEDLTHLDAERIGVNIGSGIGGCISAARTNVFRGRLLQHWLSSSLLVCLFFPLL